jgi:rSAM/selenodomain-associated transferase 1
LTGAAVLVLAKPPVPGRVKTRLCPPCTPDEAARIAAAALADTLAAVRACGAGQRVLALAGEPTPDTPDCAGLRVIPQRGGGLGDRIAAAFADAAALGPISGVLQIGMDTPQLTGPLLNHCLAELASPGVDAVLGPAEDGGWWVLGLRDPAAAALVAPVPMSTSDTGRLTEAALRGAGLRVARLPVLRDVDHWSDARAVAAAAAGGRFAATVHAVAEAHSRLAAGAARSGPDSRPVGSAR